MNHRFLLPALFLLIGFFAPAPTLWAQESGGGLPADPARARYAQAAPAAQRTAALPLPFFDDFSLPLEGNPSPDRWLSRGGTLVNNRFAVGHPSRGVATFDGLNAKGQRYAAAGRGLNDTLTSQPINLNGLAVSSDTYLSFFWQAGSVVGQPNTSSGSSPVYLQLEMLDNTGAWVRKWQQFSTGAVTSFAQVFIKVDEARFFHANFQFRFSSYANYSSVNDLWNLDYVVLGSNRNPARTNYNDITLSKPLNSLFKRYATMPVWQYNAAASQAQELNDAISTTYSNLHDDPSAPIPITWTGTITALPSGSANTFVTGNRTLNPYPAVVQAPLTGSGQSAAPTLGGPTAVRQQVYISKSGGNTGDSNDTINRVTPVTNYYAYDDGTMEGVTNATSDPFLAVSRAIRIDLNRPDQVSKIKFYFVGATSTNTTTTLPTTITLNFAVWDVGSDGLPLATPKATKVKTLNTGLQFNKGLDSVEFDMPVPVSGAFYFGYVQASTYKDLLILFGADYNSTLPPTVLYDRAAQWYLPTGSYISVPMIRPVMTGIITSTRSAKTSAAIQVYPNPSRGQVNIAGSYRQAAVLDALGRVVWQQPTAEAGRATLELQALPPGLYLLRLTLPDGSLSTHRVVLEK